MSEERVKGERAERESAQKGENRETDRKREKESKRE